MDKATRALVVARLQVSQLHADGLIDKATSAKIQRNIRDGMKTVENLLRGYDEMFNSHITATCALKEIKGITHDC
jgi:hypothetical protein